MRLWLSGEAELWCKSQFSILESRQSPESQSTEITEVPMPGRGHWAAQSSLLTISFSRTSDSSASILLFSCVFFSFSLLISPHCSSSSSILKNGTVRPRCYFTIELEFAMMMFMLPFQISHKIQHSIGVMHSIGATHSIGVMHSSIGPMHSVSVMYSMGTMHSMGATHSIGILQRPCAVCPCLPEIPYQMTAEPVS